MKNYYEKRKGNKNKGQEIEEDKKSQDKKRK